MRRSHAMLFGICFIQFMLLSGVACFVWLDVGSSDEDVQTRLKVYVARFWRLAVVS